MSDVQAPVLAISPSNDRMHIGLPATVLKHVKAEEPVLGSGTPVIAWQFYDSDGIALVVEDGDGGEELVPQDPTDEAPGRAARQILVARVDLVLAHAQLRVDQRLAERTAGGDPPGPGDRTRMVRVQGEFGDVLTMLFALEPDLNANPEAPNPGSWWHNFWAH